jgi:hypothetical protein
MRVLRSTIDRILPALLMAAGVALVVSGLLSYLSVPAAGEQPGSTPGPVASSFDPGSPLDTPAASPPGATEPGTSIDPSPIVETLPPTASPLPGSPTASPTATPLVPPTPSPRPTLPNGDPVVVSRVRVPSLGIDLPVVSGALDPPGNPDHYPLCNVSQYLTGEDFGQPFDAETTYLFAHARAGMFLPLLDASLVHNGAQMLGKLVQVYTNDGRMWLYEIFQVKRHATDFWLAWDVPTGEHRLILQTSEGGKGHIPKLQVAARLLAVEQRSVAEATPAPKPLICF